MKWKIVCTLLLFLLPVLGFARNFTPLGEALKGVLPEGQKVFKTDFQLTKEEAAAQNKIYDSDLKTNEKLTVYYTKNSSEAVTGYAIVLEEILWKYVAFHKWVIGFSPDGKISGIRIVELTDEYTFQMPDPRFLGQFRGLAPQSIKMPGNVDAMTSATMSSELLISSTSKAWALISLSLKKK